MNTRRDFIKTGIALGAAITATDFGGLFAAPAAPAANLVTGPGGKPVLVALRHGTRTAMLDRALQALGGIGAFVKKGQTVVIKPNIAWDVKPELSANTHPDIVGRLVELCLEAGAKEVSVFDHTCDRPDDPWGGTCYITSGIRAAVEKAGGKMFPGNDVKYYRDVTIPGAVELKEAKVHSLILDSDVFINVPVLKQHGGATMTACMKNMMGVIWDRRFWHRNNLHQCIADFIRVRKPALNIVDAYAPMVRNGPRGKSAADLVHTVRSLLAGTDIVAVDAAASKLLGHDEDGIPHVKIAAAAGLGACKLDTLKIERVTMTA
ncbi:MAG: DUF362 domain-containing protein [Puniceicoccales bacterium]|jgi:uncharacterized protein (DUF362 family)|nr:DUF362 domain-containing protein [Puniceicoccales bacterium]